MWYRWTSVPSILTDWKFIACAYHLSISIFCFLSSGWCCIDTFAQSFLFSPLHMPGALFNKMMRDDDNNNINSIRFFPPFFFYCHCNASGCMSNFHCRLSERKMNMFATNSGSSSGKAMWRIASAIGQLAAVTAHFALIAVVGRCCCHRHRRRCLSLHSNWKMSILPAVRLW